MAEEQAVGVTEQSGPSAAATPPEAEAQNDGLAVPTAPSADGHVADDEASEAGELDELLAKASERDEYLALAQRTQADFENYRKRIARESTAAESRGLCGSRASCCPRSTVWTARWRPPRTPTRG
jgi:molecular chaperone GrpE